MKRCPTCQRLFVDEQESCPLDDAALARSGETAPAGVGRVLGSYRLISLLGEGGMGSIYIGAHTRLANRYVAIKVLRPELSGRKDAIARFFQEARTVNGLKHPNIVESIDLVEDVVDGAYCVLELLRGPDLKTLLAGGALPLESAVTIAAQIGDALAAVHEQGIVHRDLKPENLILIQRGGRDDFVKLIDFGVAQISDEKATGIPFGTAAYMAPEQAAGERVDGRADVYSLGVLLFEMTTGRHPFPSSTDTEYLVRHADEEPPRPTKLVPAMPRALEAVILRCLAKPPDDRYPSASAVSVALRAIDVATPARKSHAGWLFAALVLVGGAAAATIYVPRYLEPQATTASAAPPPRAAAPAPAPSAAKLAEPAKAEEAPPTVAIQLTSEPAGARVFREGETVPLGTTPFTATLLRADRAATMRFELPGYAPAALEVSLASSHAASARLTKLSVAAHPAGQGRPAESNTTKKKQVQREGVMDPFAN